MNYFEEVEQHFGKRRGKFYLMSPKDFGLVSVWHDAGIPLEAVLRGIDAVFDKWEKNFPARVNSIAYCEQSVLAACEKIMAAQVGRK